VRLPLPLVHPHLVNQVHKLLKAGCWACGRIKLAERKKLLLLARLRFDQVGDAACAAAVKAYSFSVLDAQNGRTKRSAAAEEHAESLELKRRSVDLLLDTAPPRIAAAIEGVDGKNQAAFDAAIAGAAELAWNDAAAAGTLLEIPGPGWDAGVAEILLYGGSHGTCPCCNERVMPIMRGDAGNFFFGKRNAPSVVIGPIQVAEQLERIWCNERHVMQLIFGLKGRDVRRGLPPMDFNLFFVENVLVAPSRFRPSSVFSETGLSAEHPQNMFYQRMLTTVDAMVARKEEAEASPALSPAKKVESKSDNMRHVADLQKCLMELYDSPGGDVLKNGGAMGIRQQLESKQGLFRMHMMGKRVNFSCRSVIGPDVFLDTNEVGIPESFAKLLTVAEAVTSLNLTQMQAAVLNGPNVYPGANAVQDWSRTGSLQTVQLRSSENAKQLQTQAKLLIRSTRAERDVNGDGHDIGGGGGDMDSGTASAGSVLPKRVLRHLRTGDIVLFNRQPTLHRVSMMAHKVRVLPGDRTIRFHYANCRSYNADFDGDEMNIHVPQDDLARAEARQLMLSDQHYIAPTSGEPIRDLIQDHILAAALISRRGTFFTRGVFANLLYSATERVMSGPHQSGATRFVLPTPAIVKPRPLWTGKQLLSAVLDTMRGNRPGLSLAGRSRVKSDLVGDEEAEVLFRDGQLLRGVLDKNSFGASKFGVVHAVQEAYGCHSAGEFLSAVGRLCTMFIRRHGHTTGVDDLLLVSSAEGRRLAALRAGVAAIGGQAAHEVRQMFAAEDADGDVDVSMIDDDGLIADRGDVSAADLAAGRAAKSGAVRRLVRDMVRGKGGVAEARLDSAMASKLNAMASTVNRCIPSGLVKKFPANGFSLMTDTGAKGSAVNSAQISCVLGSTIMEGKRVPRMGGSGATLPCFAPYDPAPNAGGFIASRFLTGIAPYEMFFHAMAGREGLLDTSLKTANSGYLQRCLVKHLEGVRLHYDYTARDSDGTVLQMVYGDDGIDPCKASWLMNRLPWQLENQAALVHGGRDALASAKPGKAAKPSKFVRSLRKRLRKGSGTTTLLEAASPGALARFGVVSESFEKKMERAVAHLDDRKSRARAESFLRQRYLRAAAEPGDAVGVIAAQSVGEPSTQMTLNTFHHAGSESKHVTLGVPRLRELLMTASRYPKTPSMTLPLLRGLTETSAKEMSRRLENVSLVDLMERVTVKEGGVTYEPGIGDVAVHNYRIVLSFPAEDLYASELGFGFGRVVQVVEDTFVRRLQTHFERELTKLSVIEAAPRISTRQVAEAGEAVEAADAESGPDAAKVANQNALVERGDSDDDDGNVEGDDAGSDMDEYGEKNVDDEEAEGEGGEGADEKGEEGDDGRAAEDGGGEDGAAGSPDVTPSDADEAVWRWKGAKRAELAASTASKPAKRPTPPVKTRPNAKAKATAAAKGKGLPGKRLPNDGDGACLADDGAVDGDGEALLVGSLGLTGGVTASNDGRSIEIPWVLPQQGNGRIRVAELVREAASGVKLAYVDRITRCFTEETDDGGVRGVAVATEGSNLVAALELGDGLVDMDRVSTNDMFGILNSYGVEALRAALIAEFQKIFGAYGIPVDLRHLSLIADYQCAHGGYRAFNRSAMTGAASTMQQFSFETTMKFMTEAALCGRPDSVLSAPSTSIATGELYAGGTGSFEILSHM
jgi:DNA-directed RNA polymerase I subunit RPA1